MASKFLGSDNTVEQFIKDCEERLVKLDNIVIVISDRIIELTAAITPVVFTHNKPFQVTDKNGWLAYHLYDKWFACEFYTDGLNKDVRVFSTTGEKMFACTMAYRNNTFRVFDRKEDCTEYVKSQNNAIDCNEYIKGQNNAIDCQKRIAECDDTCVDTCNKCGGKVLKV